MTHRRANPPTPGEEKLVDVVLDYCGNDDVTAKGELVNFVIGGYMSSGDSELIWFYLINNFNWGNVISFGGGPVFKAKSSM